MPSKKTTSAKKTIKVEPTVQDMIDRMQIEAEEAAIDSLFEFMALFEGRQEILMEHPGVVVDNGPMIRAFLEARERWKYLCEVTRA